MSAHVEADRRTHRAAVAACVRAAKLSMTYGAESGDARRLALMADAAWGDSIVAMTALGRATTTTDYVAHEQASIWSAACLRHAGISADTSPTTAAARACGRGYFRSDLAETAWVAAGKAIREANLGCASMARMHARKASRALRQLAERKSGRALGVSVRALETRVRRACAAAASHVTCEDVVFGGNEEVSR